AGRLRTAAQFYNPSFLVGELDGEAHVELPGLRAMTLNWQSLQSSVRYARPVPQRLSFEARDLQIAYELGAIPVLRPQGAQLHLRRTGEALDLAANLAAAQLAESVAGVDSLPPMDAVVDATINAGVEWLASLKGSLRGHSGTIRNFSIISQREGSIT